MSSRDAREPSFMTFVVESTLRGLSLPESVSWFFDLSNFWTLPWSELALLALEVSLEDAVEPVPMPEDDPVLLPPVVPCVVSRLDPVEPDVPPL